MRLQPLTAQLVSLAVLLPVSCAFSVTEADDADTMASAMFGQGITVLQASFSGTSISSGTFTDGPFGIGSGAILTSGLVTGALPGGAKSVNNEVPGSDTWCGPATGNAAILSVIFLLDSTYSGIRVEFVLASQEGGRAADPIGIFVGSKEYAVDSSGNRITAASPYLLSPLAIEPPNSGTSYYGSSPPLRVDILISGTQRMVISICDQGDESYDSGLLIKAEGCIDCETNIRLAYVTTTTTLSAGEEPFTSTTAASGTVPGTILIGVVAATTEEPTTTAEEESTTTTDEETTTTDNETTSIAANEDTTTAVGENTTTTDDGIETGGETTTTTADDTIATTQASSTESTSDDTTTNSEGSSMESTSGEPSTTTTQDTTSTTAGTSTETSGSVKPPKEQEDTSTTTILTSDTTPESPTVSTEFYVITATTRDFSTQTTAGTDTISTSDAPVDGTDTSSGNVETSSISSTVSAFSNKPIESPITGISTDDSAVPIPGPMTTAESLETTTVQQAEASTNAIIPPSGLKEEIGSSDVIASTVIEVSTQVTSSIAASSIMPSNLAVIGNFRFFGCLGSPEGYPTFELIGEASDMTTAECVRLGARHAYIGIYLRSCYAGDSLDAADTVSDGRCDLPCPGDPGLFCGGVADASSNPEPRFKFRGRLSRRDAPPGILLTLYARIEAISGTLRSSYTFSTVGAIISNSLLPTIDYTVPLPLFLSTKSFTNSAITVEPSVPITRLQGGRPINPLFPIGAPCNEGNFTSTRVTAAPIATTITYTVVDPHNPSQLTVTEFCSTLRPSPCRQCQHQPRPTVEMTTIKVDCNACGHSGENTIILEVPAGAAVAAQTRQHAAYQTHRVQYYELSPYEQRPHPIDEDSHNWQKSRPQNDRPITGDRPHEGDERYKFDQPQTYHDRPSGAGDYDEGKSAGIIKTEPSPNSEPTGMTKTEPKPDTMKGNGQHKSLEATFHRRPGPAFTSAAPDAPIVVVSTAVAKTTEGTMLTMFFLAGLVFLL